MSNIKRNRKTKIICTIGPASDSGEMVEKLVNEGMDGVRINFSHGIREDQITKIDLVKEVGEKIGVKIPIILDTQGPEIRLGRVDGVVRLENDQEITLTTHDVIGTKQQLSMNYPHLTKYTKPGDMIYIKDGVIELEVLDIGVEEIICKIISGGRISSRKNVAIPSAEKSEYFELTEKDQADIIAGVAHRVDIIAQSFVRNAEDIRAMRELLGECNDGKKIKVFAKIETNDAVRNIKSIIKASDGVIVARGDLGVQVPIENLPILQKLIVHKCNNLGKPVAVATHLLESMTENPRPTRAEVTDVSNAVLDGADYLWLSGETATGKYPLKTVNMMNKIIKRAESSTEQLLALASKKYDSRTGI